jgi:hypothetical protein
MRSWARSPTMRGLSGLDIPVTGSKTVTRKKNPVRDRRDNTIPRKKFRKGSLNCITLSFIIA